MTGCESQRPPRVRTFVVAGDDRDPRVFRDRATNSLRSKLPYLFDAVEQQDDLARRRAAAVPGRVEMTVSGVSALGRFWVIRGWIDDLWVTFSVSRCPVEFDLFEDAPRLSAPGSGCS